MTAVTTTEIAIAGCKVRVMRKGRGAPFLILHGSSGAGTWLPFMEKLSASFDVIVPEHPGFGGADMPDWLDNIHDMAYYYIDFLEQLDLKGVHLVGLSLGGWIAAELAVRNTSRLASLTLVGSGGLYVKDVPVVDAFLRNDEQRIRDLFHDQKLAESVIARALAPELEDVNLKNRLVTAKLVWQPRGYDPNLRKWLHRIDVPTLLLWGASDRLIPKEYAEAFHKLIPESRVVLFPDCGHIPNIEKADAFVAEVVRFANEARAAS
jgi:pimeloyl-ACP methyl ester carboxylesterase